MTNNDIQQISKLLEDKLAPIQKTLDEHSNLLKEHGKVLGGHSNILKSLKKDQDIILNMLDKEQMKQRKRLERVEEHLDITPPSF